MLHAEKHTAKININDSVPLLEIVVGSRGWLFRLDAGVIEREIQPSENFSGLVQRGLHIVDFRDIATDGERPSALFLDYSGGLLVSRLRDVSHDHACTFASKRQRRGASDASSRASDECNFPYEIVVPVDLHLHVPFQWLQPRDPTSFSEFPC